MLDFLEAMGRLFMGALRLLNFLDGLYDFFCGLRWAFSSTYRAEVRSASDAVRFRVYSGVFLGGIILAVILIVLVVMAVRH